MARKRVLLPSPHESGTDATSARHQGAMTILSGKDCLIQASSEIDELALFLIAILQRVDTSSRVTQVIIIPSTRELAEQIYQLIIELGGPFCQFCIGGKSIEADMTRLLNGPAVVIGTHARVIDLIRCKAIKVSRIHTLCLNEADAMVDSEFKDSVCEMLRTIPIEAQFIMLSNLLPDEVLYAAKVYMRQPSVLYPEAKDLPIQSIQHRYISEGEGYWQFDALCNLYDSGVISKAIVFCASRGRASWLTIHLVERDVPILDIHGGMDRKLQDEALALFRSGEYKMLISTDMPGQVFAGVSVSMIINYDMPYNKERYLSRVMAGGDRLGQRVAITLVREKDVESLVSIAEFFEVLILEMGLDASEMVR